MAGYDGIQGLSSDQRVNNADTYALYANGEFIGVIGAASILTRLAIYMGC